MFHNRRSRVACTSAGACLALALLAMGCEPELGECDSMAAFELVYTADGLPATAGQGLVNQSCGGGGFCHASGIDPVDQLGAPAGIELDLSLIALDPSEHPTEVARLDLAQRFVVRNRRAILDQVQRGLMPPSGPESEAVLASTPTYERVSADGRTFRPLPEIGSAEGREILRNWLACEAPLVSRTVEPNPPVAVRVGCVAPTCARRCVDPTWPDIVERIFIPSCGGASCHGGDRPAATLDLTVDDVADGSQLAALHGALLSATAAGVFCGSNTNTIGDPMLVPGDPDASLLYRKTVPALVECGSVMPAVGNELSAQSACAIREWIACGACVDPTDSACAACLDTARTTCGVVIDGSGDAQCAEQANCEQFNAGFIACFGG